MQGAGLLWRPALYNGQPGEPFTPGLFKPDDRVRLIDAFQFKNLFLR